MNYDVKAELLYKIIQKQDDIIENYKTYCRHLVKPLSMRSDAWLVIGCEMNNVLNDMCAELASLRQQLEECDNIKFYSYCDSCGTLMVVKRSEIELLCMNPKCDNYIKQQMK